jgi:hypothetical protein
MTSPKLLTDLSPHQQGVGRDILRWWMRSSSSQVGLLHGLAGTGKTTLAVALGRQIADVAAVADIVAFAAPTGKGAAVLHAKGGAGATTLHRLLYYSPSVKLDDRGRTDLIWSRRNERIDAKLIIAGAD